MTIIPTLGKQSTQNYEFNATVIYRGQPGLHRVTPSYETKTKNIKETL